MSTTVVSLRSSKPNSRQFSNASTGRRRTDLRVNAVRDPPDSSLSSSRVRAQRLDDTIHLSPQRKTEMLELMRVSEAHVVSSMTGSKASLTLWKPRMRKKGIAYYVDEQVPKGSTRFCCVGLTDAPVAEIMKMFMVANTETLLKNVRIMYRNVKEAKILSVLQPATSAAPYRSVYIRYANFDTPTIMSGRDICVCVYTDMIHYTDGSTVGYCLWDSVDIPECPDRFATDKIIRSRMKHSGFFFRNSGRPDALTKVCYLINVEIGGIAPQLTGRIYMTIFGGNCRRVCKHYRNRSLDPETFKRRADWTPKQEGRECNACARRFNPLMQRYHCVSCGEVVCCHCFYFEEVSVRGAVITRVRICKTCLEVAGMLGSNLQAIARDSPDSPNSEGSGVRDLLRLDSASSRSSPFYMTP